MSPCNLGSTKSWNCPMKGYNKPTTLFSTFLSLLVELLEELRNSNYEADDALNEETDQELSEIWSISGHNAVTDFNHPKFKLYRKQSNERNNREKVNSETKETRTDNYMRYIDTNEVNDTEKVGRHVDLSDPERDHNVDADDEDSENDTDSDSDDDMFDVCIKESLSRRRRVLPYHDIYKSRQYHGDAHDDDDIYEDSKRPLVIIPIKRRYAIQESLRIRVLRSEASKAMASIFKSKCSV